MRYSVNNYVKAFIQTSSLVSNDKAVSGLVGLLKKTGDIRYLSKITEAIHKKLVKDHGGRWLTLEKARETANVGGLIKNLSNKDHVETKINPELVAGVRITINEEEELDNSLKNKLNQLFK